MARGRMLSKVLSTSEKYAALGSFTPELVEFCQALYPLLLVHTDDCGRLQGDPFTVKAVCYPASHRSLDEFAEALWYLDRVDLIRWYVVDEKQFIQIHAFASHQRLQRPTPSTFPADPKSPIQETNRTDSKHLYSQNQAQKHTVLKIAEPALNRREEKGIEEKRSTPLPPLKGGRVTRAELNEAKEIRRRVYGICPHDPRCARYDACVLAIALARKAKLVES